MEKVKYVLGMDPSGSFNEGKGTTGWCLLDTESLEVLRIGSIAAKQWSSDRKYWAYHRHLIKYILCTMHQDAALSIEDYILYKNKALSQSQSTLETVQLLGFLKMVCYDEHIPYYTRNASIAKKRWTNDIMVRKGIIVKLPDGQYALPNSIKPLCGHELDSIRHALHFAVFENGKEKQYATD